MQTKTEREDENPTVLLLTLVEGLSSCADIIYNIHYVHQDYELLQFISTAQKAIVSSVENAE